MMHGQLPCNFDEKLVDIEQLYWWLKSGDIRGETESTIVATQDQAISTNYFKNKILKEETDSKCQLCKQHEEIIDLLTYWPNLRVLHFGKEWILNETRLRTFALLNMQSVRHAWVCARARTHTHTHKIASVWKGRCHAVVESSSTHIHRSYKKLARYNN